MRRQKSGEWGQTCALCDLRYLGEIVWSNTASQLRRHNFSELKSDENAVINWNFHSALLDLLRTNVLRDGRVFCGELRQLPVVASDWRKRVPCVSPDSQPTDHRLYGDSDADCYRIDDVAPVVQASSYLSVGNLAGARAATYCLGFNCHHSIADSSATEQGWLIATTD
jgi:hypothetical protein